MWIDVGVRGRPNKMVNGVVKYWNMLYSRVNVVECARVERTVVCVCVCVSQVSIEVNHRKILNIFSR